MPETLPIPPSDRTDKQFIITLSVAAGALAATLLGWTSKFWGIFLALAAIFLLLYAIFYSQINKENRIKQWTHAAASSVSGHSVALLLVALTLIFNWWESKPSGFAKKWPDAIACTWHESESPGQENVSTTTFIFRLSAVDAPRQGSVAVYEFPGGCMRPQKLCDAGTPGCSPQDAALSKYTSGSQTSPTIRAGTLSYVPHELWFSENGTLIRPTGRSYSSFNPAGQSYKFCFLDHVQCGGETIREIANSGHAYYFARNWK